MRVHDRKLRVVRIVLREGFRYVCCRGELHGLVVEPPAGIGLLRSCCRRAYVLRYYYVDDQYYDADNNQTGNDASHINCHSSDKVTLGCAALTWRYCILVRSGKAN